MFLNVPRFNFLAKYVRLMLEPCVNVTSQCIFSLHWQILSCVSGLNMLKTTEQLKTTIWRMQNTLILKTQSVITSQNTSCNVASEVGSSDLMLPLLASASIWKPSLSVPVFRSSGAAGCVLGLVQPVKSSGGSLVRALRLHMKWT